jgi:hypothetical protein
LTLQSGDIKQLLYKRSKDGSSALAIDELNLNQPLLRFEIDAQGYSNFRRLFAKPDNPQVSQSSDPQGTTLASSPAPEAATTVTATAFNLDIRSTKLRAGQVFFVDQAMRPQFTVDMTQFNATLLGISNAPGHFATVAMEATIAKSGSMQAKGRAAFSDPRLDHDIAMNFRNLPLTALNPPAMNFAGYQLADGRLNLYLNYKATAGQLNGSNQIIIKNVQLGDEVPNYAGTKLPLGLAIALLEDSNNTIDVTIKIAGDVNSPEFSAAGLVWQAIKNILSKLVTAPFRALAALMGMGDDQAVDAVLGEAVFLPADQDQLEQFGDFLSKHPNSSIELSGAYDPEADKKELARVKADRAILQAAGFKLSAAEPVPLPTLSDSRIQSGLKSAYAQNVGRIQLTQRLIMLPDNEARNEQLRTELINNIEISTEDLKTLANNRAVLARQYITKNDAALMERITLGKETTVSATQDGVPLVLQVKAK